MYPWQQHTHLEATSISTLLYSGTQRCFTYWRPVMCVRACVRVFGGTCVCVGVKQQLHTTRQGGGRGCTFSLVEVFPLHSHQISGGELVIHQLVKSGNSTSITSSIGHDNLQQTHRYIPIYTSTNQYTPVYTPVHASEHQHICVYQYTHW